jgi:hypothetical protein
MGERKERVGEGREERIKSGWVKSRGGIDVGVSGGGGGKRGQEK